MSRVDFHLGVSVAIVAALVAVVDLVNGRLGDDQIIAVQEKDSAFVWYQAKSIKETLAEGNRNTLETLEESGLIANERKDAVDRLIKHNDLEISRYRREKTTILEGGPIDGQTIPGARYWEARATALDHAGDAFDVAMLFVHLALLLGGIGVAVQHPKFERVLLRIVIGLGVAGVIGGGIGTVLWMLTPSM